MKESRAVLALVTGANGFVGSHLCRHLRKAGYRVRAMVRTTSDLSALEGMELELACGDVTDPRSLPAALEDVDLVIHAAGITKSRDREGYFRVNRDGTRALAAACTAAASVSRFVYISSQAAAGPSWRERARREEDPPAPIGPYGESKLAGEEACREAIGERIGLSIVRPSAVYGPWERDLLHLFRLARRGVVPRVWWDSRLSLIHAADLADLIERAGSMEVAAGRIFFGADPEPYRMSTLIRMIAAVVGRRVVQVPVPPALLWPFAAVNEQLLRAGRGFEALTRTRVKEYRERYWAVDSSRAREELGWAPGRDLMEGLEETGRWYRERGWL